MLMEDRCSKGRRGVLRAGDSIVRQLYTLKTARSVYTNNSGSVR